MSGGWVVMSGRFARPHVLGGVFVRFWAVSFYDKKEGGGGGGLLYMGTGRTAGRAPRTHRTSRRTSPVPWAVRWHGPTEKAVVANVTASIHLLPKVSARQKF